ncbi:MAG: hypothetical protein AB7N91_20655 [Candidatus Tectimicrobiota bacterium]
MGRTYHKDEWARRRTQALFRLLRTQAPADFRARVLRRAQAMPPPSPTPHGPATVLRSTWQRQKTWLLEHVPRPPRQWGLAMGLGGVCLLLIGLRLAGWPLLEGARLLPDQQHLAAGVQPDEPRQPPASSWKPAASEPGGETVRDPALGRGLEAALIVPAAAPAPRSKPAPVARVVMPPRVPPTPWAMDEHLAPLPPPRPGAKRAPVGKVKRSKKTSGPGKHAPA